MLHFAVFLKHSQFADLNSASMKLWGKYPHLAVFPGALILDDGRPGDRDYPSSNLTQDQLSAEEPALSDEACQAGARQCLQEGICLLFDCMQALGSHKSGRELRALSLHSACLQAFATWSHKVIDRLHDQHLHICMLPQ